MGVGTRIYVRAFTDGGTRIFLHRQRGQNLLRISRGDQNFFAHHKAKGGPGKIGDPQSQTDAPSPGKNDSSPVPPV